MLDRFRKKNVTNYEYGGKKQEIPNTTYPTYTDDQWQKIAIMLASITGEHIHDFCVIRQFGDVFVVRVSFVDTTLILPFIFKDYGYDYKRSYKVLIGLLSVDSYYFDYRKASRRVKLICDIVGRDSVLSKDEFDLFFKSLYYVISHTEGARSPEQWLE